MAGECQDGGMRQVDMCGQSATDSRQGKRFIGYCLLSSRSTSYALKPKNVSDGIFSILSPHNFVASAIKG